MASFLGALLHVERIVPGAAWNIDFAQSAPLSHERFRQDHSCDRRRKEYGGLDHDQARRMKVLEKENVV
jgi:hypothetical protein